MSVAAQIFVAYAVALLAIMRCWWGSQSPAVCEALVAPRLEMKAPRYSFAGGVAEGSASEPGPCLAGEEN